MEKNNIDSPLILKWDDVTYQYKVNKPEDQSGEYVDKIIADKLKSDNEVLLNALKDLCSKLEHVSLWDKTDEFYYRAKAAIKQVENK